MNINWLSDVQQKPAFTVKKEEWKHYRDGFKDLLIRVESFGINQEKAKQFLNNSLSIVNRAKNGGTVSFEDSLILTETLCFSIAFLDRGVQDWVKGESDDKDIRLCMHYRRYLVYLLYQLSEYQKDNIYRQLLPK